MSYIEWFSESNKTTDSVLVLVWAPLTFGHTQLIINFKKDISEHEKFIKAHGFVAKAIQVFNKVMIPQRLHDFSELAQVTGSSGHYIKTLILRVSSKEENNQYKVHMLPYFSSHEQQCKNRFHSIHNGCIAGENGGLIAWLGDREGIVDNWQMPGDNPFNVSLDKIARERWMLDSLAIILSKAWPD